jgi:ATP-binding cassette subfamily B protein
MVFRGAVQYVNAYLTQWIGQKTIFDLRMQVYEHLQRRGLAFFDRNPIGRLITRVTNDVEVLNEMFSSGVVMVFSDIFTIIGILYFMFSMNWQLALLSLSVCLVLGTFFRKKRGRPIESAADCPHQCFMQEHITG